MQQITCTDERNRAGWHAALHVRSVASRRQRCVTAVDRYPPLQLVKLEAEQALHHRHEVLEVLDRQFIVSAALKPLCGEGIGATTPPAGASARAPTWAYFGVGRRSATVLHPHAFKAIRTRDRSLQGPRAPSGGGARRCAIPGSAGRQAAHTCNIRSRPKSFNRKL